MLNAWPTFRQFGFSLVELLIGILILGILASVAIPSFQTWVKNSQVRNAAESITDAIQRARSEAVSRNANVAFSISNADTSWGISMVVPSVSIASAPASEGSLNVVPTISPSSAVVAGTAGITFSNLGTIQPQNANGSIPFTAIDFSLAGANMPLRVTIGVGGNAKLCDPSAPANTTRSCN